MNPRQWSLVIWLGVAVVVVLVTTKGGALDTLKAALEPKLLVPAALSLGWIAAIVYGFYRAGLWTTALWWDTLVFALVGTTMLAVRTSESKDFSRRYYGRVALQTLGLSVLLGTFVSTYTFILPIELFLVPWLFFLGAVWALAGSSEELAPARKPAGALISITGFAMLAWAIICAIANRSDFLSLLTAQSLILEFVLTATYLPYLFLFRAWITYETAFVPLRLGVDKPRSVQLYARARMIVRCRLNLPRLERFRAQHWYDLSRASTRAAVDQVFDEAA